MLLSTAVAKSRRNVESIDELRTDPTTGLLAFGDLYESLGLIAETCVSSSEPRAGEGPLGIGIAVGDVDGLKSLIEGGQEGLARGHLVGHRFMQDLGTVFLRQQAAFSSFGCAATFGGDEVVAIAASSSAAVFERFLSSVQKAVISELPRSISFVWEFLDAPHEDGWRAEGDELRSVLIRADEELLTLKRLRRSGDLGVGFCKRSGEDGQ